MEVVDLLESFEDSPQFPMAVRIPATYRLFRNGET